MASMKQDILEYLLVLQQIVECRETDFENWSTPYALETRRGELHRKLFEGHVFPFLEDGTDFDFAYQRSKELFSRFDPIWHIYDSSPFDLNDMQCLRMLSKDMASFLLKTETLFYLEGRTAHIHGLNI